MTNALNVFLVPVGANSYECYYEAVEEEDTDEPGEGFLARLLRKFNEQLKEAERARHEAPIERPKTFLGRMQQRSLRWIAERRAEQRLLWHLRKAHSATLHVPADMPANQADTVMRASMKRDADRHRTLLIPHTLALVASAAVAVVPGPNVLAYLLFFTAGGHFLSWRGAVNALHKVQWTIEPNPALTDLHAAFALEPEARHRMIVDVSQRLHMPRMARFVERMATSTS